MLLPELGSEEFEAIPIVTGVCLFFYSQIPPAIVLGCVAAYMTGFYVYELAHENLAARNRQLNREKDDQEDLSISKSTLLGVWVVGSLKPEETEWTEFQRYSVKVMLSSILLVTLTNFLILIFAFITISGSNLSKSTIDFVLVLSAVFQSSIIISNVGGGIYAFRRAFVDEEYRDNMNQMMDILKKD